MHRFKLLVVFLVVVIMFVGNVYCEEDVSITTEADPNLTAPAADVEEKVEEVKGPTLEESIQGRIKFLRTRCKMIQVQYKRFEDAIKVLQKEFNEKSGAIKELEALLKEAHDADD